jgi:hypothetical protein
LNDCFERADHSADWLLKLEARPFTLNTHYLADYRDKFISFYKAAREKETSGTISTQIDDYSRARKNYSPTREANPTGISRVLLGLTELGLEGIKAKDICKLLPEDHMEPAIRIMADVRAYFQGLSL